MFIINGMYLLFFTFMSCPEPPLGISSVGSFQVESGGPLTIFPVLLGVGS